MVNVRKLVKDTDYKPRDKKKENGSNTIDLTPKKVVAKKAAAK